MIDYKTFDYYIWTWAKEILYKINKGKQYKDNYEKVSMKK